MNTAKSGLKIALELIKYLRSEESFTEGDNSDMREYEYRLKQIINNKQEWVKEWLETLPAFNDDDINELY